MPVQHAAQRRLKITFNWLRDGSPRVQRTVHCAALRANAPLPA
eukprot:CAMPEP_0174739738 /NCGR_PEP_ID=MMETSP1094-20130205/72120_1 /TAXON_ID=156173 /ORGANISM="Chrysochromulina brevifilum, Strain UTEX LB 985" /LENGTH=42 /DNA_ID= /DNA_START= /DNA_END= /DNA_ORIENTATION=